ncbi:MAG: helix-turn-helix transcriptional regulator [Elusimicrobiaceae bacterium]|nr:helix-turn-helix transcriptional regulator [Elusimicrobiaceae bacterium]
MNKFEKQLEKWNKGVLRGAQAKLAKCLQVSTATVALWTTGKRHPSKGYVAKMAQLFHLDIYDVSRLFAPTTLYQSFYTVAPSSSLRDADNIPSQWEQTLQDATVSLPVFSKLPIDYPRHAPTPLARWIMPRNATKGATFLFLLPTKQDPDRLLFIQPYARWENGKKMLCQHGKHYVIAHIKRTAKQCFAYSCNGENIFSLELVPVGIVVREIVNALINA